MLHQGLDFSFSGLKTAVSIQLKKLKVKTVKRILQHLPGSLGGYLGEKSVKALKQTGLKRLVIAGGVSANKRLRERLEADLAKNSGTSILCRTCFMYR